MSTLRVRQILQNMDTVSKTNLRKLLPSRIPVPEYDTFRYPSALLSSFPDGESYSILGFVAEHLLRLPSSEIHLEALIKAVRELLPSWSASAEGKIRTSKTTQPFLDCLVTTRKDLEKLLRTGPAEGPLKFEDVLTNGSVEGHPDIYNKTQIFEVKLTGMLKQNWSSFLLQVYAYGALLPSVTDLYLVLPLQQKVWHADIRGWDKRGAYLEAMTKWSSTQQTSGAEMALKALILCGLYQIGTHTGKQKQLLQTVSSLGDYSKPYQIFLSGPQNSNIKTDENDIAATLGFIRKNNAKIYVHSQYIINLSAKNEDNWHTNLLIKNLQVARAFGSKGVVVHVGKSTTQPLPDALKQMRTSLLTAMEHATWDCPILLETPAGQGTETLTKMKEFLDFVETFGDLRIRACIDTCHVFACGFQPLEYIDTALGRPGLIKLIHFNDSLGACGSCVDRHAHIGMGNIGFETMSAIAGVCSAEGLPMLVE